MPIRPAGAPGPGDGTIAPLCGQTTFHYWSRPPTGVNPYEQFTIYGVVIRLASGTLYYLGQSFHPTSCNANATLLHGFGLAVR